MPNQDDSRKSGSTGSEGAEQQSASEKQTLRDRLTAGIPDEGVAFHTLHIWQIQAVRDLLLVAAFFCLIWIGYAMQAVTVPLLVALLLAYLFEPMIARISRHPKISRTTAVTSTLIVFGGGLLILVAFTLPMLIGQTTRMVDHVRDGGFQRNVAQLEQYIPARVVPDFQSFVEKLPGDLTFDDDSIAQQSSSTEDLGEVDQESSTTTKETPSGASDESSTVASGEEMDVNSTGSPPQAQLDTDEAILLAIADEVQRQLTTERERQASEQKKAQQEESLDGAVLGIAQRGIRAIGAMIASLIGMGFMIFLVFFYFFFFSVWYPQVIEFGNRLIPKKNYDRTVDLLKKMDRVVAGFVRGRIVISAIMGALLAIGWWISGVPYAIPVGLLVGVFCAVPYLGFIGVPLAIGLLFYGQLELEPGERMAWWGIILWPSLVFGIVQVIEGYILTPVIAGKATNLDPVTILVAVLAGGSILGVYGMLLAIPVAACVKIIITEIVLPRVRDWLDGTIKDPLPIERD